MKLPFVSRKKYDRLDWQNSRLAEQVKREALFQLHIPMLSIDPNEPSDVVITGPEEAVEKIKALLAERQPVRWREMAQLILNLHDKKWSFESDRFLRELNINPEKYWEKYMEKKQ